MLHAHVLGDGPPVVCLHPGPGLDHSVFLPEFRRVADAGFRVLLADLPGNGQSPPPAAWTLDAFADAVEELGASLGEPWTLLGHSFGGMTAMHHLSRHGTAQRYVCSGAPAWEEESWFEDLDPVDGLDPEVAATVREAFVREHHVKTPEDCRLVWHDQAPVWAADPGPFRRRLPRVRFSVEAHREHDWGDLDARAAVAAFGGPILAIAGGDDRSTPPYVTRPIAGLAARGTYVEIPGTGHFPWMEDADAYLEPLIEWLRAAP